MSHRTKSGFSLLRSCESGGEVGPCGEDSSPSVEAGAVGGDVDPTDPTEERDIRQALHTFTPLRRPGFFPPDSSFHGPIKKSIRPEYLRCVRSLFHTFTLRPCHSAISHTPKGKRLQAQEKRGSAAILLDR